MAKTDVLENLPEINLLKDEGITYEGILNEMIADFEAKWKEITGDELTLYPADSRRIMLNVAAGKLYQLAAIINERFKLNFLQYMYGEFLKNWGSNFGYKDDGLESAKVVLRFYLSEEQPRDITIPVGTRATNGDHIYFATDEDMVIPAGELSADVTATCTIKGTTGNGYVEGQLNIIADPVNLVNRVENITQSAGGHDEYTNQELRELIYNFPATYSTAGPEESYEEYVKSYSNQIMDVKVITDTAANVTIYVLLAAGEIPDESMLSNLKKYMDKLKVSPDTDNVQFEAPDKVDYDLNLTYYISSDQKDVADALKEAIEDAVEEFVLYTKSKIGRAVNPNTLVSYMKAAGASRIEIESPGYRTVESNEVAMCKEPSIIFGGLEEE